MENFLEALFNNQQYDKNNFFLIAGPCVVEGEAIVLEIVEKIASVCKRYKVPYVLKASYKKANRTSASSFTGIGDKPALEIIKKASEKFAIPSTTDIHTAEEATMAADYV